MHCRQVIGCLCVRPKVPWHHGLRAQRSCSGVCFCLTDVSSSARSSTAVRAQLTADRPTSAAAPPSEAGPSACPFLASLQSLPAPPTVKVGWHQRFKQLFSPQEFQRLVMSGAGDASVVQVAKQIGFTNFIMPKSADMVKEVFAGESTGVTRQADISSFGEQGKTPSWNIHGCLSLQAAHQVSIPCCDAGSRCTCQMPPTAPGFQSAAVRQHFNG